MLACYNSLRLWVSIRNYDDGCKNTGPWAWAQNDAERPSPPWSLTAAEVMNPFRDSKLLSSPSLSIFISVLYCLPLGILYLSSFTVLWILSLLSLLPVFRSLVAASCLFLPPLSNLEFAFCWRQTKANDPPVPSPFLALMTHSLTGRKCWSWWVDPWLSLDTAPPRAKH